jgi:hypothetical protein
MDNHQFSNTPDILELSTSRRNPFSHGEDQTINSYLSNSKFSLPLPHTTHDFPTYPTQEHKPAQSLGRLNPPSPNKTENINNKL